MSLLAVEIEGLDELVARAKAGGTLVGKPLRRFFTRASLAVQKQSRELAPVDTGRLRSSINYDVDSSALPLWAEIGPSTNYGASVEFGIGDFNEGPGGLGQRRLPTAAELEGWARRHGMNAYAVARIIEKRGGIPPRPYMRPGFEDAMLEIDEALDACATDIEEQWRG